MNSRARHARSPRRHSSTPRTRLLLRAGLTVTAAGAVVGGTAGAASASSAAAPPSAGSTDAAAGATDQGADQGPDRGATGQGGTLKGSPSRLATPAGSLDTSVLHRPVGEVTRGLGAGASSAVAPARSLRLNPFARSSIDPADNTVGTSVADSPSVSTAAVTAPIAQGGSVDQVADHVTGLLGR